QGENSERPTKREEQATELMQPRMRVDFPRWEGDLTGWFSRAERYFRSYRTPKASMVDIAAIHLERDAIQWYNWYKHTHGIPTWRQFKIGLLCRFGPSEYDDINGQLAKIRQTSIVQKYQTRFERLSNQAHDWSEKQLLGTFTEGLKPEIREEVKARQPYTMTTAISFA
ncbi:hypothetical protein GW17_00041767, partial [Ensete ventricosum]